MKVRRLIASALGLAAVLVAASLLSRGLLDSLREPEVYDPRGGRLAVDGLWIGMTYARVVRSTGQEPDAALSNIFVDHVVPGYRLDTLVGFDVPEGGYLASAIVSRIEGSVLTQDGRLLLDLHSVSWKNPANKNDIVTALGTPRGSDGSNMYYYLGDLELTIHPYGSEDRISLQRSDRPAPHSAQPPHPDPRESLKP